MRCKRRVLQAVRLPVRRARNLLYLTAQAQNERGAAILSPFC